MNIELEPVAYEQNFTRPMSRAKKTILAGLGIAALYLGISLANSVTDYDAKNKARPEEVFVKDVNGDGLEDVVVGNQLGERQVYIRSKDGTYSPFYFKKNDDGTGYGKEWPQERQELVNTVLKNRDSLPFTYQRAK